MAMLYSEGLDATVIAELMADIADYYAISEAALLHLDRSPDDQEVIARLFRSVHTIKGNLGVVGFSPGAWP